jgi:hypothetical protein
VQTQVVAVVEVASPRESPVIYHDIIIDSFWMLEGASTSNQPLKLMEMPGLLKFIVLSMSRKAVRTCAQRVRQSIGEYEGCGNIWEAPQELLLRSSFQSYSLQEVKTKSVCVLRFL